MLPIDLIDAALLKIACPENTEVMLTGWVEPIKKGCAKFGVDTVRDIACLLAQAGEESAGFTRLSENLNYSPERLMAVWPHRFQTRAIAVQYGHNPERLANFVYANRLGNGPPESGDGWRYRGFGLFQLTGAENQREFGQAVGLPLEQVPAYLRTTEGAAMSACWFFKKHGLHDLAKSPGCADETRAVNGGILGLADRTKRFNAVVNELLRRGA